MGTPSMEPHPKLTLALKNPAGVGVDFHFGVLVLLGNHLLWFHNPLSTWQKIVIAVP